MDENKIYDSFAPDEATDGKNSAEAEKESSAKSTAESVDTNNTATGNADGTYHYSYVNANGNNSDNTSPYSYTPKSGYVGGSYGGYRPPEPPKKKEKRRYGIGTVILSIILSALICTTLTFFAFKLTDNESSASSENTPASSESSTTSSETSSNSTITVEGNVESLVEAVYEKAAASVVGIRTTASVRSFFGGTSESTGEGSGVIYSSDGYIITNYHVIESVTQYPSSSTSLEVFFMDDPDEPVEAKLIGYNASADLAVVKVNKTGLRAVSIGNSDDIKVGQYAIAIGCPGGIDFIGSVSYGIISGLNRTITVDSIGEMKVIQTDAAINPGNSGGALLSSTGELIGVSSSKLINTSFEGMGFAIPVNTAVAVVKNIIENKDNPTPYIGIEIYKYDSAYLEKYNLPHGAAVKSVVTGAPAANAGIRAGDIITQFGNTAIDEYDDFIEALNSCTAGTKVNVKIYRNSKYYTTTVTIGSNNSQ